MRPLLSVCITAYNAEALLPGVLAAVAWVPEVIVLVDDKSRDATEEIAREWATRVVVRPHRGHIATKRECAELARGEWVLNLDADEVMPDALRRDMEAQLAAAPPEVGGFEINRLTHHLGRWIRHGDFYPDWTLRLVRRETMVWGGEEPHVRLLPVGQVGRLATPMAHYSYRDLADQVERVQAYSGQAARAMAQRGRRARVRDLLLRPPWAFFRGYVLKRGFLDGIPGLVIAVATAFHVFLKYAKLWERQQGTSQREAP